MLPIVRRSLISLAAAVLPACYPADDDPAEKIPIEFSVFVTADEHGWIEGTSAGRGAANLMSGLATRGAVPGRNYLLLSAGAMWTGPAISTWFEGESTVEVMNAMGYRAAAVANHEFDFGQEALQVRIAQADFPFLSANIRMAGTGEYATGLGIAPYTVLDVGGVDVGIIGLTTELTPWLTESSNIVGLEFMDAEAALREIYPEVRAVSDVVLVLAHICGATLTDLVVSISDLEVGAFGSGGCDLLGAVELEGTPVLSGGTHFTGWADALLEFDPNGGGLRQLTAATTPNLGFPAHVGVAQVVDTWTQQTDQELGVVIGHLDAAVAVGSTAMGALNTETWLWAIPSAEIAIANAGGIRASLSAGQITKADVVGVQPFDDAILRVELTGSEVAQVLGSGSAPVVGGIHPGPGGWTLDGSEDALNPGDSYVVLVNSFIYGGGDGFGAIASADPDGVDTGFTTSQPILDWIEAQDSSSSSPLDASLAELAAD